MNTYIALTDSNRRAVIGQKKTITVTTKDEISVNDQFALAFQSNQPFVTVDEIISKNESKGKFSDAEYYKYTLLCTVSKSVA